MNAWLSDRMGTIRSDRLGGLPNAFARSPCGLDLLDYEGFVLSGPIYPGLATGLHPLCDESIAKAIWPVPIEERRHRCQHRFRVVSKAISNTFK